MKRKTMQRIIFSVLVFVLAFAGLEAGRTVNAAMDVTPPVIKALSASVSGEDAKVYGAITSSEAGNFYYVVLRSDNQVDMSVDYIRTVVANKTANLVGTAVGSGYVDGVNATAFEIQGLLPRTRYVLYAYMTDLSGNDSSRAYVSTPFYTNTIAISGTVNFVGEEHMVVDATLKASPQFASEELGVVSYQWYRIALTEDQKKVEEPYDVTGGAAEDILQAYVDEDDLALDGTIVETGMKKLSASGVRKATAYSEASLSDTEFLMNHATLLKDEEESVYKIKKEDIGSRLVVRVTSSNYLGSLIAYTNTFVPKEMPEFELPQLETRTYSPGRTLASIGLPEHWSWVNQDIVPVVNSNGYRALYTPEDSRYTPVIVRVDVPLERKSLTESMMMVLDKGYTGKRITDNFEVADNGTVLKRGIDYIVTYRNNLNVGTATVIFKGVGNYKTTISEKYKITKRAVSGLTYTYVRKTVYTGGKKYADLIVENGTKLLKKGRDYTVTYKNNKNIGIASAVVRGIGNYKGKKTINFYIIPKAASLTVTKQVRSYIKLKFGQVSNISGYTLDFAKDASFSKGLQRFNISKRTLILRGIDRGEYYYLRLRTFKIVNGEKIYSKYSKKLKVWIY